MPTELTVDIRKTTGTIPCTAVDRMASVNKVLLMIVVVTVLFIGEMALLLHKASAVNQLPAHRMEVRS